MDVVSLQGVSKAYYGALAPSAFFSSFFYRLVLCIGISVFIMAGMLCLPLSAQAQASQPNSLPVVRSAQLFLRDNAPSVPTGTQPLRSLHYQAENLLPIARSAVSLVLEDFPLAEQQSATVSLQRIRPSLDATTQVWVATAQGDIRLPLPQVTVFRGSIEGETGSRVLLCLADKELIVSIRHADGSAYTIAPSRTQNDGSHYLIADGLFHTGQNAAQQAFACMSDDLHHLMQQRLSGSLHQSNKNNSNKANLLQSDKLLQVNIAVESDTKFFNETGKDSAKAAAYIASLISLASVMYEDDLKVSLFIPWMKIWTATTPDPYDIKGNGYSLVWKAKDYWNANYTTVQRDVAHILTSGGGGGLGLLYPLDNGGGGTVLCNKEDAYASSSPFADHTYPTLDFTYGVYIVAHELGHNFGAVHSHNCFWNPPFDTCVVQEGIDGKCFPANLTVRPNPGSIMSYCAGVNLKAHNDDYAYYRNEMTFLPRIAAYMRAQVEQTECIAEPVKPTIILTAPRGNKASVNDTSLLIQWMSTKVQYVTMEYSTDKGASWKGIVADVAASALSHRWWLPFIKTKTMLVRIYDVTNPLIADTSIVAFSLENTVGVDEETEAASSLRISQGIIRQSLTVEGILPAGDGSIELFSMQGRELYSWALPQSASLFSREFDVHELAAGAYYLRLRVGSSYRFLSIIKE